MSQLKVELENIYKNLKRTEKRMGEIHSEFIRAKAPCCPSCWSHEYSMLATKQENREERAKVIRKKLGLDKFTIPEIAVPDTTASLLAGFDLTIIQ